VTSSIGQLCINVTDLERSVAFYEALGLECTSRTEIPQAFEAIVEHAGGDGGKLQLAEQKEPVDPFALGTALGTLTVATPHPGEGSVHDPDGHLVELVKADAPSIGPFSINVTDIGATVAFYELLGLGCTSRVVGGQLQLTERQDGPIHMGSLWKLYVDTDDLETLHAAAVAAGHVSLVEPMRLDRWPVTISFLADPDGYQVELVQRHPD
jgi:catechol 2,3-dioxygenase-like lactoylglutathione lyase family enzyme